MQKRLSDNAISGISRVLIATFSPWKNGVRLPINGNLEPMRDFFVQKVACLVLIDQVYPGSDFVLPRTEMYEKNKPVRLLRPPILIYLLYPLLLMANRSGTQVIFKIRDYFSVLFEGLRSMESFDIFIGFEAINALAGVVLRSMGKVRRVVYYVSDYSPNRYNISWFNSLYLWLDRQAAMRSDVVWDVSKAMMPARIRAGLDPKKSAPVLHVPNALYPSQIKISTARQIHKHSIVFLGTLGYENGPDIAVEAMCLVRKCIPDAMLHIIGGNEPNEDRLKVLAKEYGVANAVVFHGFINKREKISALARTFAVALAPYKYIEGSARLYGDATKIRAYLAAGLPVITTSVPPLGADAARSGAAMIVKDSPEAFAEAIVLLFRTPHLYKKMRACAIRFAKNNTWDKEYEAALLRMKQLGI